MREVTTVFSDTANLTQTELNKLVAVAEQDATGDRAKANTAVRSANYFYKEVQNKYAKRNTIDSSTFDTLIEELGRSSSVINYALH